jgi:hypothetical protein
VIIIWKGAGLLVPVIGIIGVMLIRVIILAIVGPEYNKGHAWVNAIGLLVTGVALFLLGRALNAKHEGGAAHSLYFVPVEYWGLGIGGFGILAFFL